MALVAVRTRHRWQPISNSFSLEQAGARWRLRSTSVLLASPSLAVSPPINIFSITANDYGYATLSFGSFDSSDTAFIVVGPDGSDEEDADGSQFMLNTDQSIRVTAARAGIQRPAHAGIPNLLRVRPFRSPHDQEGRVQDRPLRQSTRRCIPRTRPYDQGSHQRWLKSVRFSAGLKRLLWLRDPGPLRKGWRNVGRRAKDRPHCEYRHSRHLCLGSR